MTQRCSAEYAQRSASQHQSIAIADSCGKLMNKLILPNELSWKPLIKRSACGLTIDKNIYPQGDRAFWQSRAERCECARRKVFFLTRDVLTDGIKMMHTDRRWPPPATQSVSWRPGTSLQPNHLKSCQDTRGRQQSDIFAQLCKEHQEATPDRPKSTMSSPSRER